VARANPSDRNLTKDNVDYHEGYASFVDKNTLNIKTLNGENYTVKAKKIVIAVGGKPLIPSDDEIPGASLGINSDGFFDLEEQPKRVAVAGAGYIAVELAGIFNGLGSETHLLIRKNAVLRTFDPMLSDVLVPWMEHCGMKIHKETGISKVEKIEGGLRVHQKNGPPLDVDTLLWAIGRVPNADDLGLDKVGVERDAAGNVVVNEWQETNVEGIYALGDIGGKALLTPVAIAAGRRLSNRLYGPPEFKDDKLDYENIPSVVFSHPTIGSVGLSEPDARKKYGDGLKVYTTRFRDMSGAMLDEDQKQPTAYKVICAGPEERVVGLHMVSTVCASEPASRRASCQAALAPRHPFQLYRTLTPDRCGLRRDPPGLRDRHQMRRDAQGLPGDCGNPPHFSRGGGHDLLDRRRRRGVEGAELWPRCLIWSVEGV
jgi:glutathione reductase (NADPH)